MVLLDIKSVRRAQASNQAFIHNIILAPAWPEKGTEIKKGGATVDSAREAPCKQPRHNLTLLKRGLRHKSEGIRGLSSLSRRDTDRQSGSEKGC